MELNLSGKKAVVTGAGSGIGLGIAEALAAEGMDVFAGARTISAELRAVTPYALKVDLATKEGPARLVSAALAEFGGLDLLVNNVGGGVTMIRGFLDVDEDVWQRTFDLNFFSAVRATRAALPSLLESKGAIVNIGSINSRIPAPNLVHYGPAKAALTNFAKTLSREFSPRGLRVNTISPGPVRTRIWSNPKWADAAGMTVDEFVASVPGASGMTTGKMIEVEEIAALVVLLASDRIPNAVGGEYLVDAGMQRSV